MGLRIRKILPILLTLFIAVSCFAGCSSEPKNAVSKKYKTLPYGDYVIKCIYPFKFEVEENPEDFYALRSKFANGDIFLLSSFEEYEEKQIPFISKDESFFDENALLVIKYEHSTGSDPIDLVDIAIKKGKLYPVISIEVAPDQNICCDVKNTLIIADVKKSDVEKYSFGEVLVLNLADETHGIYRYERFE